MRVIDSNWANQPCFTSTMLQSMVSGALRFYKSYKHSSSRIRYICLCLSPDRTWYKVNDQKVDYSGGVQGKGNSSTGHGTWTMMQLAHLKVAQPKLVALRPQVCLWWTLPYQNPISNKRPRKRDWMIMETGYFIDTEFDLSGLVVVLIVLQLYISGSAIIGFWLSKFPFSKKIGWLSTI